MVRLSFYDDGQAEDLRSLCRVIFGRLAEQEEDWPDFWRALYERQAQGDFYLGEGLLLPHCWWPGQPRLVFLRLAHPIVWSENIISHIIFFCLDPADQAEMRPVLEICFREKGLDLFLRTKGEDFQTFLQTELKKGGICYEI